jgi:hypothetical protein
MDPVLWLPASDPHAHYGKTQNLDPEHIEIKCRIRIPIERNWILKTDLRAKHGEQAVAAHNVLVSGPEAAEFRLGLLPEDLAGVAVVVDHHVDSSEDQLDVRTVVPSFAQLLPAPLHDTFRNNKIPLFNNLLQTINILQFSGSGSGTLLVLVRNISFFSFFHTSVLSF